MREQLVFIDESGDPGFKFDRGSSSHFVIACVIFDDKLDAEEAALIIKKFRRKKNLSDNSEFKFNKTNKTLIKELLKEIVRANFRVCAISIDKTKIRSHELRNNKESFYNYAVKLALSRSENIIDADIRIDGHASREYKKSTFAYLRKEVNVVQRKIAKIRFVDSQSNVLIQLADIAAGSVFRLANVNKSDRKDYIGILKDRVEDIWNFE
jgi:hypothetical protein